jgi:transposase
MRLARARASRLGPDGRGHLAHFRSANRAVIIVWHLLPGFHADLGPCFYDTRLSRRRKMRNHARQIEALGYKVTLEPAA